MSRRRIRPQSGQVMVLVAVALVALIGSAALVLLAGSVQWQGNQLQQLADQAALDSALKIGIGCDAGKASTVITEADNFIAAQRGSPPSVSISGGSCTAPYTGTDSYAGGLSAIINYPYRAHQQQVEVVLTLTLPISFGGEVGKASTSISRRAVGQQLGGSVPAISATTLTCNSGQVNIAGSVLVHDPIVRNGTCALYAHARFDATSGTYSDLGNVSVYTDGPWNAPGTCNPGFNTGSLSAICSDGFELSGHATLACGTVAQSYLLTGDKTINPNPCAAGTGPQPVAPLSLLRPPEPNTDAAAIGTLQGTGGLACSQAGAYNQPIVVNSVTVATALAPLAAMPSRTPDASGFYHFKPSCYGYLGTSGFNSGISNVQTGPESPATKNTVTPTLPAASQAGTMLVADIRSGSTNTPFTAPAGWLFANGINESNAGRSEIWYYPNNPGGIASAIFNISPGSVTAIAQLTEWRNVVAASPLDRTGTLAVSSNQTTATIATSAATASANELVITNVGFQTKGSQVYTPQAGWTSLKNDVTNGFGSEYRLDLPAGAASETVASNKTTRWSMVIATFKPATGGLSAVLDPGFYYFNGSGFGGGGGICLNGGTLLAKDVTLEFVGTAGFSSGTCAAGGGANCIAPCHFGSDPANAAADPPTNLTWFASPCTLVPNVGNTSCPVSPWCPAGDRACDNLLIWAASTGTGQIAVKGPIANAWLLGSIYWPSTGTCSYTANGTSMIAGSFSCGILSISAAGVGTDVGGDYGVSTALVEAVLVE